MPAYRELDAYLLSHTIKVSDELIDYFDNCSNPEIKRCLETLSDVKDKLDRIDEIENDPQQQEDAKKLWREVYTSVTTMKNLSDELKKYNEENRWMDIHEQPEMQQAIEMGYVCQYLKTMVEAVRFEFNIRNTAQKVNKIVDMEQEHQKHMQDYLAAMKKYQDDREQISIVESQLEELNAEEPLQDADDELLVTDDKELDSLRRREKELRELSAFYEKQMENPPFNGDEVLLTMTIKELKEEQKVLQKFKKINNYDGVHARRELEKTEIEGADPETGRVTSEFVREEMQRQSEKLEMLKEENRQIYTVDRDAQNAFDYLKSLQGTVRKHLEPAAAFRISKDTTSWMDMMNEVKGHIEKEQQAIQEAKVSLVKQKEETLMGLQEETIRGRKNLVRSGKRIYQESVDIAGKKREAAVSCNIDQNDFREALQQSMSNFLDRAMDGTEKGHKNSPEFTKMYEKIQTLSQQMKEPDYSLERLEEDMKDLGRVCDNYVRAKQGWWHLIGNTQRTMRLNFASSVSDFANNMYRVSYKLQAAKAGVKYDTLAHNMELANEIGSQDKSLKDYLRGITVEEDGTVIERVDYDMETEPVAAHVEAVQDAPQKEYQKEEPMIGL
ncbi:MAG: hypothetical protein PUB10_08380 [Clostridiales bacterium]|nr:hypothetical protein [Clostridiales bacterium]